MEEVVRYLPHDAIDLSRWDRCIDEAGNGLVYAYSFYLDHMAVHWDALIWGDYEAVMPLTWKQKYGIRYLYQPSFAASLGVFGRQTGEDMVSVFLQNIPAKFRLIDISLNRANCFSMPGYFAQDRTNYVLSLKAPYETLSKGYRENVRRNIKKAQQAGCYYEKNIPVSEVVRLAMQQLSKLSDLAAGDYENFKGLYAYLLSKGKAVAYGVYMSSGELVSSCVYFFSHGRAYYILVGNHPNGRTIGASHYLIDRFIFDHAGEDLLLDFEGSDIRNLAFFYSSFGAVTETYPYVYVNRLPWYLRWLKK